MIIFLYGSDTFRSRKKLDEWIAKKSGKSVGFNVYRMGLADYELIKLKELIEKVSIFETKKLIVLENIFGGSGEIPEEIEKIVAEKKLVEDKNNLLIFWNEGVGLAGQKTALFQKLTKKPVMSQRFDELKAAALKNWLLKEIQGRGGKISAAGLDAMLLAAGSDLWRQDREIDKLIAYRRGGTITDADVKMLVVSDSSTSIFDLTDALGRNNRRAALAVFYNETKNGRDELEILGMIAGHFRRLLSVRSMIDSGRAISASLLGFKPYVFQKTLNQSHNFTFSDLKSKFRRIAETDFLIKTGKIDKRAGLEMLIFGL